MPRMLLTSHYPVQNSPLSVTRSVTGCIPTRSVGTINFASRLTPTKKQITTLLPLTTHQVER
jgi:hypothetical protein